ncbi:MAG: MMPL family transporter, partial [Gammaproteobacteria bacterium]
LLLSFRSLAAMIFPWLVIAAGLLLVNEIQSYLGLPHSTVDSALMPTLIIIGIGITVHLLVEYFHFTGKGRSGEEAAHLAICHIFRPALFTAVTTAAGFYALSFTRIEPVRDFALLGAIGPLALFLFAMTVLPAMLSYRAFIAGGATARNKENWVTVVTNALPDFTRRHRIVILVVGAIVMVFSLASIPTLNVDNNYVTLFKENSVTRADIEYFDREFRGMMTLDVILDSGRVNGVRDPQFLRRMDTFQTWLQQRESLGPINSLVNYLKEINMALNGDDPAHYRLPETAELAAQYMLLYDSAGAYEDLSDLKDFDERYTRLTIPIVNMPATQMQVELDEIQEYLDNNQQELQPLLTGTMVLFTVQDMYTSEGMFRSFTIAMLVISAFFVLLFRSVKYGVLSVIPSILPIVFTASIVSMVGIYLDLAMLIVGAMTMGIAVDDAIHVMNRYLMARKDGQDSRESISRALNESGRAVIYSSIVLVLGFSVLSFGSFTTIIYIGIFGSVIMALALLGDLLLLPAILYSIDGHKEQPTANA